MSIFNTERPTETQRDETESSPASQWFQGPQLISLSSETLVPYHCKSLTEFSEEYEEQGVPEDGKEIYVFIFMQYN